MMENVTLQDLGIGYLSKDDTKWVAQHLNGVIYGGELTCLLGRNGIGKSTLLRTLSAFQPAFIFQTTDNQLFLKRNFFIKKLIIFC